MPDHYKVTSAIGGRDAYRRVQDQAHSAMVVITVLGAVLFELLAHYTAWSFVSRIGVSLAAVVLSQYLAVRLFNRPPSKTG